MNKPSNKIGAMTKTVHFKNFMPSLISNFQSSSRKKSVSRAGILRNRAEYRKYDTSLLFEVTDLFRLAENPIPDKESNKSPMSMSLRTPTLSLAKLQIKHHKS